MEIKPYTTDCLICNAPDTPILYFQGPDNFPICDECVIALKRVLKAKFMNTEKCFCKEPNEFNQFRD